MDAVLQLQRLLQGLLVLGGMLHLVVLWQQPGPQVNMAATSSIAFALAKSSRSHRYRADSQWIKQAGSHGRSENGH